MAGLPTVTIAIVGKVGVGKSTLVNRILNTEAAKCHYTGGRQVTQGLSVYETEIDGISYRVIDTPGLQDISKSVENDKQIVDGIMRENPNVILYCISILPSSKINEVDKNVSIELSCIKDVWKRTIVVLTFVNMVAVFGGNVNREILQWTNDFQSILKDAHINVTVKLCMDVYNDPTFDGIVSIPAGLNPSDKLPQSNNWVESLFEEIQRIASRNNVMHHRSMTPKSPLNGKQNYPWESILYNNSTLVLSVIVVGSVIGLRCGIVPLLNVWSHFWACAWISSLCWLPSPCITWPLVFNCSSVEIN